MLWLWVLWPYWISLYSNILSSWWYESKYVSYSPLESLQWPLWWQQSIELANDPGPGNSVFRMLCMIFSDTCSALVYYPGRTLCHKELGVCIYSSKHVVLEEKSFHAAQNTNLEDVAEANFSVVQSQQFGCTRSYLLQFSEEKPSQLSPGSSFQGYCHNMAFCHQWLQNSKLKLKNPTCLYISNFPIVVSLKKWTLPLMTPNIWLEKVLFHKLIRFCIWQGYLQASFTNLNTEHCWTSKRWIRDFSH